LGRQHQYSASISKEEYSRKTIKQMVKGYFEGSFSNIVSFMVKDNNISIEELETLLQQIRKQKNQRK
jgi:predicted transcriptional regulator